MRPALKFDKRLVDRHVRLGLLGADELTQHLDGLADVTERGAPLRVDFDDVGVTDVARKDAGETDD